MARQLSWLERMIHNHEVPGSIPGPATQNKVFMNLFHGYLVSLLFILDLFFFSYRITGQRNNLRGFGVSGNFWLVIFKISYLCLPLFYETRTTPSCTSFRMCLQTTLILSISTRVLTVLIFILMKKSFSKIDFHNVLVVL